MFNIPGFTIRLTTAVFLLGLFGCTGEIIEEGYYNPDFVQRTEDLPPKEDKIETITETSAE